MNHFNNNRKKAAWGITLLTITILTGCGGGDWNSTPGNGDETPTDPVIPTANITSPNDGATDVSTSTAVNVTFNTPMDESSINETSFTLTGPEEAPVAGEVTYAPTNMTATFIPTDDLEPGTRYDAVVTTGVLNEIGQAMASDREWSFTTAAEAGTPVFITVMETNPIEDGVEVCINKSISASFSEPLDPESILSPALSFTLAETFNTFEVDGEVTINQAGTVATFTPTDDLNPELEYTATLTTDIEDENGNALEEDYEWSFTTSDTICQQAITLGATELYGVLSNTGITLGGGPDSTTGLRVDGDVGIFPSGACNGCDSTTVSGLIEVGTDPAEVAQEALEAAYNEAINRTNNVCTLIDSGSLATNPSAACGGGADGIYAPGLYWSGSSIAIPAGGTITLDGGNDNNAVFIFQSETTVNTEGGNTHIILQNGAQAKNVFWVAGSSATIGGSNSDFTGTILALIGITVNTGTDMVGRALARGAEVVVQDGALITVPAE